MVEDPDEVAELFATIASEQDVIDQIASGAERLRAIQRAKQHLASLDAEALRQALARRHAALELSA